MNSETTLTANKQLVIDFFQHAFGKDKSSAFQFFSDTFSWWVGGDASRLKASGRKERDHAIKMMSRMHKVLPEGMNYKIKGITAEGDRVAAEVEAQGPWIDGRRYHNHYHFLFEVRDGKIDAIREYMDTLHVYEMQEGELPR